MGVYWGKGPYWGKVPGLPLIIFQSESNMGSTPSGVYRISAEYQIELLPQDLGVARSSTGAYLNPALSASK